MEALDHKLQAKPNTVEILPSPINVASSLQVQQKSIPGAWVILYIYMHVYIMHRSLS